MPSRIIREGWLESENIDQLDAFAERFFLRLCLRADDFGRYHANPTLLRSNLFPLKEDVRITDITRWLAACEKSRVLRCYSHEGKAFLEIRKFDQRTRAQSSKFPTPPPDDGLLPGICLTEVSRPRTYSDSESETKSDAHARSGHGARAGEGQVAHLPDTLNTPAMVEAWERWLVHWSTSFANGRPMPEQTAHAQLRELLAIGPERSIAAINNSITKGGLRKPCEPFAKKGKHADNRPSGRGFEQSGSYAGVTDK